MRGRVRGGRGTDGAGSRTDGAACMRSGDGGGRCVGAGACVWTCARGCVCIVVVAIVIVVAVVVIYTKRVSSYRYPSLCFQYSTTNLLTYPASL